MHPTLLSLGRSLPLAFFAALLVATQIEGQGICAAGYYGAWAAHFFEYPRKYGRKAVLAAARSLSWGHVAFIITLLVTFAVAPISGEPGELSQWLMFVVGLIASEVSIFAYGKDLHHRMSQYKRAVEGR
jgi:hypothetical protein